MHTALRFALDRKTWLTPLVLLLGLAGIFPAIYLAATVDPQSHLSGLPIALVVEEQTAAGFAADELAAAVTDAVDSDSFELEVLSSDALADRMADDAVAAAIVIPSDFDAAIASLVPGSTAAVTVPVVHVRTNAGDGGVSNGLVAANLTPLLTAAQVDFGAELSATVAATGIATTATQDYLLGSPFTIRSSAYETLPDNAGFGTSAFYFALVLVLLGFIGASVVNPLVDAALGFAPSELGPLVSRRAYLRLSRRSTLLTKFGIIVAASPFAAALVQLVAGPLVGVPVSDPVQLWLFSSAVVAAIGTSALTVFAIFGGGIGSLVNTVFFIALSMTSSGGTVPLEAVPPFFRWASEFEPFHAVIEGVRSILYFDANPAAGLADGWTRVGIGAGIGIVLGLAVTTLYARNRMFTRHPRPVAA
jgi:hypothetical protein